MKTPLMMAEACGLKTDMSNAQLFFRLARADVFASDDVFGCAATSDDVRPVQELALKHKA